MAKTFVIFDIAKHALMTGGMNLSNSYRCALISAGAWTPTIDDLTATLTSTAIDATWAHQKGSAGAATRKLVPPGGGTLANQWTKTANGVYKFDLSDIALTASTGFNITTQYAVVYESAGMALGFWEISTAAIVASQVNITWPADGLFETSDNV